MFFSPYCLDSTDIYACYNTSPPTPPPSSKLLRASGNLKLTPYPSGYGLNPPALVNIYHTHNTTMLFLHEYGDTDEYNWFAANGCTTQKPLHMCIAAIDPDYRHKFQAIKVILEQAFSYTSWFPCKLEVIDSMLIEADATPDIPCSGILRPVKDPWRVGVVPDGAPSTYPASHQRRK